MADYPVLRIVSGAGEKWRDPLLKSYSLAGGFKGRRLQPGKTKGFVISHKGLTTAQRDTLETFYDANRSIPFNFWWPESPGTVYSCVFADENGLDFTRGEAEMWDVSVKVEVV